MRPISNPSTTWGDGIDGAGGRSFGGVDDATAGGAEDDGVGSL
ncbi:hypothetical protein [Microcystis aeruginosa]|nr:hypothetical protein [Microcystis aeruginosa]